MGKQIIVTVGPKGQVKAETEGYLGESCKDAAKGIEKALGASKGTELKEEYYRQEPPQQLYQS